MGLLDQITLMKSQGRSDQDIINNLKEQGLPPKMIQDAMAQAQIKEAVSKPLPEEMQKSIMGREEEEEEYDEFSMPQPEISSPIVAPQPYPEETQEYYQQEYYPQEGYAYTQGATDTGTLIEIAEQVFSDKIKKNQKQVDSLVEFKTLAETKIATTEERLRRIESTIDKLQLSILDKIGSYGENLDSIKKEMSMMQDSFSKVINPVLDKAEKRRRRS